LLHLSGNLLILFNGIFPRSDVWHPSLCWHLRADAGVAVCCSSKSIGYVSEVILHWAQLVLDGWLSTGRQTTQYVTSHTGRLSLLPSTWWEMRTIQTVVMLS